MSWISIFNRICVWLARPLLSYAANIHVRGAEHLPSTGAFLLVSNHISHFDPPIFSCIVPRHIEWIATKELFGGPIGRRFFQWLGAIPLDRSHPDNRVLREATYRLKSGAVVGIFPEGGIRDGKDSLLGGASGKSGFATLSILSGAPIVPCVVLGSDRLYENKYWRLLRRFPGRAPVWIAFGKPIQPIHLLPKHAVRDHIHTQVITAIRSLADTLKEEFHLQPNDFPQSAQQRRGERRDPHAM